MRSTVQAMQQGAYDYLTKPIDFERLHMILRHAVSTQELSDRLSMIVDESAQNYSLDNVLIGRSRGMIEIYKTIGNVSQSKVTVLIEGESGTGKELIARAVHFNSPWKDQPFIAVNCTALTETLLESELFGHTKGSFTGAIGDKQGKFELAGEGTIFLDEIGEISQSIQVKLLRILQQREFERVGGDKTISMTARVVAATNRDMKSEVKKGNFREDLYYRLNVVCINVPPLRERKEDLENLVKHLLNKINHELHTKVWKLTDPAMQRILQHGWPGNVRELENVLTRAVVLSKSDVLEAELIPEPVTPKSSESGVAVNADWRRTLDEVEREHMRRVLKAVNGNRTEAARILGISKQTLYTKLPKDTVEEADP
jgi:DNA-binding NtrC family response regulator